VKLPGGARIQPSMALWIWMNDPGNYEKMERARKVNMNYFVPSRIPQFFPVAVKECFGFEGEFKWNKWFDNVAEEIKEGNTVQIMLKNPGHYISVIGYSEEDELLSCHDPNKKNGDRFTFISRKEFKENVDKFMIIYYPPKVIRTIERMFGRRKRRR
jgi:hypothetical protein